MFNVVFVYRRVSVCIVCLFMMGYPALQLQFTLLQNIFISIYIGLNRPYKMRKLNWIENVNECLLMFITLVLIIFTDFVDDRDIQYDLGGWVYVLLMTSCIVFNLSFVTIEFVRNSYLTIIKYYKRV